MSGGLGQVVVNGLLLGGLYSTMALGLALTLGVMRVINVAHSAFILLGAYVTFEVWRRTGVNPLLTGLAAAPLFFGLGALVARYVVEPLAKAHETIPLVALFGLMVLLETGMVLTWTADTRRVTTGFSGRSMSFLGISVPMNRLLAAGACLAILAAVHLFIKHHRVGKAMRAMAEDRDVARILGIDVRKLGMAVFGLGTATAAYSGAALSTVFAFTPQVHFVWLAWAFLIVVLGGLGSVRNTVLAGFTVGLSETLLAVVLPFQHVYVAMYVALALVLLIRTEGLSSVASRRV